MDERNELDPHPHLLAKLAAKAKEEKGDFDLMTRIIDPPLVLRAKSMIDKDIETYLRIRDDWKGIKERLELVFRAHYASRKVRG